MRVKGINTPEGLEDWWVHSKCSINFSCSCQICSLVLKMTPDFEVPDRTPEHVPLLVCLSVEPHPRATSSPGALLPAHRGGGWTGQGPHT